MQSTSLNGLSTGSQRASCGLVALSTGTLLAALLVAQGVPRDRQREQREKTKPDPPGRPPPKFWQEGARQSSPLSLEPF